MSDLRLLQKRFAAALRGEDENLDDAIPDAARRIAIHRTTHLAGLIATLIAVFPVTRRIVGAPAFGSLAEQFAVDHPPRQPVLSEYGAGFPAFLAAQPIATTLPYLHDTARLEWLRQESYQAVDAQVLDATTLETSNADAMSALHLAVHPATRIITSPFPLYRIWRVNQADVTEIPTVDMTVSEHLIVTRPGMEVITRPLTLSDAALVRTLMNGGTLSMAVEAAFNVGSTFDVTETLAAHFANGTFAVPNP